MEEWLVDFVGVVAHPRIDRQAQRFAGAQAGAIQIVAQQCERTAVERDIEPVAYGRWIVVGARAGQHAEKTPLWLQAEPGLDDLGAIVGHIERARPKVGLGRFRPRRGSARRHSDDLYVRRVWRSLLDQVVVM